MTQEKELEIARSLAANLLERHAEVAEEMVMAITREVPHYSHLTRSDALFADIREHCDGHTQAFLSSFLSGTPPEDLDIGFAEDAVTRRVRRGVPLGPVLHSFRVGHQAIWQRILRAAEQLEAGRTAAVLLVEPSIHYTDAMSTLVADVYVREQQQALTAADRLRRDVLELLLTDAARGLQAARGAGIALDPDATHHVLTATVGAVEDPHALQALEDAVTHAFATDLVLAVVRHRGVTALLRGDGEHAAERAEAAIPLSADQGATAAAFGIGLPARSLAELGRAHEQAAIALGLATETRPVVALADVSVTDYLIASADHVARSMIPEGVRALAQSKRASDMALVHTLQVYLTAGLNVQQAATMLPAHPNTVHHRLRRLAERTGYDTHDAEQLLRLSIELQLVADA